MQKERLFSITIFTFSLFYFTLYLVLLRFGYSPSSTFAWVAIVPMVGSIIYQVQKDTTPPKIILAQIFLLSLVAHLISVIPYESGETNQDWLPYIWTTRLIMENGFWELEEIVKESPYKDLHFAWVMPALTKYPILYLTSITVHKITSIDLETICHWLPSIWSSTGVIAIYLVADKIQDNKRTALFAALGFSTYITFITFHAQYVREGIAFALMLFAIWAFISNRRLIFIILSACTVLAHWNVSIMLIGTLAVIVLSSKLLKTNTSWCLVLLVTVILMSHWIFIDKTSSATAVSEANTIVREGTIIVQEGELPILVPQRHETTKGIQVSYATWILSTLFVIGMAWKIITDYKSKSSQLEFSIATALWVTIVFIVYCVGLNNVRLHPGRTAIFLYPLMMVTIAGLTGLKHNKLARYGSIALIMLFVLSGIWRSNL